MFATTFVAGIDNIFNNYLPKHTAQGNLNAALSAVMLVLVLVIFFESVKKSIRLFAEKRVTLSLDVEVKGEA